MYNKILSNKNGSIFMESKIPEPPPLPGSSRVTGLGNVVVQRVTARLGVAVLLNQKGAREQKNKLTAQQNVQHDQIEMVNNTLRLRESYKKGNINREKAKEFCKTLGIDPNKVVLERTELEKAKPSSNISSNNSRRLKSNNPRMAGGGGSGTYEAHKLEEEQATRKTENSNAETVSQIECGTNVVIGENNKSRPHAEPYEGVNPNSINPAMPPNFEKDQVNIGLISAAFGIFFISVSLLVKFVKKKNLIIKSLFQTETEKIL